VSRSVTINVLAIYSP